MDLDIRNVNAKANAGMATGITALGIEALGILGGGGLGNILGNRNNVADMGVGAAIGALATAPRGCCSEDHNVNRYELGLQQKIAEQASQIALRDANTYGDQKMLEMYKYVDGRFREFETEFKGQAVLNQKTADSFDLVSHDLRCCKNDLQKQIEIERNERKCADNKIVNYANATFYPKEVANVTVGTTTTAQTLYNPLCGCDCDN